MFTRAAAFAAVSIAAFASAAQSIQVQAWTTEEGLPQNSVHAVLQTWDGYLWVATENGAARFDGQRFTRFFTGNEPAFVSNDVCCLAEGQRGSLLLGTTNGLVLQQGGRFRRVSGISGPVVALSRESSGAVAVLTSDALFLVRDGVAAPISLPLGVAASALGTAANGDVLIAGGSSLFRMSNQSVQAAGALPISPRHLAEDAQGRLWLASAGEVLALRSSTDPPRRWVAGQSFPASRVETLQLRPGGVLVGTNRGAVLLGWKGERAEALLPAGNNTVLSATSDRDGDTWLGTDSGGLLAIKPRPVGTVAAVAGDVVTALAAAADGTMWVGTRDNGLRHLRSGEPIAVNPAMQLSGQVVSTLAPDTAGGVWAGSPDGLDHVTALGVEHFTAADGLPDDFVRSLLALPDGTVWAGTRRGAAELRGGRVSRVLTSADGLPSEAIGSMLRDRDGKLWIGTTTGLVRFNGSRIERIETADHASFAVTSLLQTADGAVWVGTGQGLLVVRAGMLLPVPEASLRSGISGLVGGASDTLWLRTPEGIVRGTHSALMACAGRDTCAEPIRQYGVADGMPSVELSTLGSPSALRSADGNLWFATRRGVAVVGPELATAAAEPPGIEIERAVLDDRVVPFEPNLEVAAGKRRVEIHFAGLSLRAPAQLRYRYRMEGFDRDWSPWGGSNVAEYTNLPSGKFSFHVQAANADGVLSNVEAIVNLRVAAPFYRRLWFYAVLALVVAGVVYAVYWLRLRSVERGFQAVLEERNRIAREIHDTLAQDFVAVSLQLEVTSQLLRAGAHGAATEQVDVTRALVHEGIKDARESIWAVRAGESEQMLPSRLAALIDRTSTASLHVTGAYRKLSPSREREMFRVAKEALGNAARHAKAASLRVELVYSEDAVLLRVSDDGAGFDVAAATQKKGHYGVRGMHERAEAMGATLSVDSRPGHGTRVELHMRTAGEEV